MGIFDRLFKKKKEESSDEYLDFEQHTEVFIKDSSTNQFENIEVSNSAAMQTSSEFKKLDSAISEDENSIKDYDNTEDLSFTSNSENEKIKEITSFLSNETRLTEVDISDTSLPGKKKKSFFSFFKNKKKKSTFHHSDSSNPENYDSDQTVLGSFDTVKMKVPKGVSQSSPSILRKIIFLGCLFVLLVGLGLLFFPAKEEQISTDLNRPQFKQVKKNKNVVKQRKVKKQSEFNKKFKEARAAKQRKIREKNKLLNAKREQVDLNQDRERKATQKEVEPEVNLAENLDELEEFAEKELIKEEKKARVLPKKVKIQKSFRAQKPTKRVVKNLPKPKLFNNPNINFLQAGSSLVYNCHGKHWACVSKIVVEQCQSSNGSCKFFEDYRVNKDCYSAQTVSVNTNRNPNC